MKTKERYKIIRTKDTNIIEHLLPLMEKLINKSHEDYSLDSFIKWFRFNISNPQVKTWIAISNGNKLLKDDSKILGYLMGSVTSNLEEEYFNVIHLYSLDNDATKSLVDTMEKWVKKNGLHKVGAVTKRNPKAWEKSYNYKLLSYNIVRELD